MPWSAHSYNVAFSDEIGHFEFCKSTDANGNCTDAGVNDPSGLDADDYGCFNPSDSTRIQIGGCLGTDTDFDGTSYQKTWPGSLSDPTTDKKMNSSSILFSSPMFKRTGGGNNLLNNNRVAFEADLPRIEAADYGGNCDRTTGAGCTNPSPGQTFIRSTAHAARTKKNVCGNLAACTSQAPPTPLAATPPPSMVHC